MAGKRSGLKKMSPKEKEVRDTIRYLKPLILKTYTEIEGVRHAIEKEQLNIEWEVSGDSVGRSGLRMTQAQMSETRIKTLAEQVGNLRYGGARGTMPILTSKRQLRKNIDLRPGSGKRKSSARPKPGKDDIVVHEEPGFRAWRSKGDKGWLTYQYKEQDGRTVTVKKRSTLLDQALEYQKSIEGRRFFGGGEVSRDMAKAFKHVWYATGDKTALTMKWMNIANAWRRRLTANGFRKEALALNDAMKVGDPIILENLIGYFSDTLGDAVVEELFNYENTLEHGQYDEYLMMDE